MIPSAASMISVRLSTPSLFSILAMTNTCSPPHSASTCRMALTSEALRIKDAAIKSMPFSTPNRISSMSFCVSAGRWIFTPGTLMPLLSFTMPAFFTAQRISVPSTAKTSNSIKPSSMRILFPGATSFGKPLYDTAQMCSSPSTSCVVSVYSCPSESSTSGRQNRPVRISGPLVSKRMATCRPSSPRSSLIKSILV